MTNLSGNSVSRVWRDGDFIYKRQPKYLCDNAEHAYTSLANTPFVPLHFERLEPELIRMEFLVSQPITDAGFFVENCEAFLGRLFGIGLRHGDLTRPHIFVIENYPCVIDWAESRTWDDPRPDKRPEGDKHWLWRTVEEILAEQNL